MKGILFSMVLFGAASPAWCLQQESVETAPLPQTAIEFHVRYVNGNTVYIDGGHTAGLNEGTSLVLKQAPSETSAADVSEAVAPGVVAQLKVISAAATGLKVLAFDNGPAALQASLSQDVAVILLDVDMPAIPEPCWPGGSAMRNSITPSTI